MTNIEYKNTLFEIDKILDVIDNSLASKIPEKLRNYIKKNKSDNYDFSINNVEELEKTKILETTRVYLASLYIKYWCDEEERREFIEEMNNNEKKYQEELREKYNPDNIFKNKTSKTTQIAEENVAIIEYKENIFKKIKNWFKSLFNK